MNSCFNVLDFDKTFVESKNKAEEALRTFDEIEDMVRNAVEKTQEAVQAMQVMNL